MDNPMILVVEDNTDTLSFLRWALHLEGYYVLTASNGMAALQVLENLKPDLILTDLMMPKVNGVDLIKELRRQPTLADIPVVVVTAYVDEHGESAVQAGADLVLRKPQDLLSLIETIKTVIGRKAQAKEI